MDPATLALFHGSEEQFTPLSHAAAGATVSPWRWTTYRRYACQLVASTLWNWDGPQIVLKK